jgi:hypothetical protein
MRGIPVIASHEIVCPALVTPLEQADAVEELERPDWDAMQDFFKRLAYTLWDDDECRSGEAWAFLRNWI